MYVELNLESDFVVVNVDFQRDELFLHVLKLDRRVSEMYNMIYSVSARANIQLISISDTLLDDIFNLWYV